SPYLLALGLGSLVVPEDRRPHHLPPPVQEDGAVHLAGEAHRLDLSWIDTGTLESLVDRLDGRIPPQRRVLLGPLWLRRLVVVSRRTHRLHSAVLGDQQCLGGGGRTVDAQYVAHRRGPCRDGPCRDGLCRDVEIPEETTHSESRVPGERRSSSPSRTLGRTIETPHPEDEHDPSPRSPSLRLGGRTWRSGSA